MICCSCKKATVVENKFPSWSHKDCTFPFVYKGVKYEGCTKANSHSTPWCSHDPEYSGGWSTCSENIEENQFPSWSHKDCTFPFIYRDVKYEGCTKSNSHSTPWCSHDAEYSGGWSTCLEEGSVEVEENQFPSWSH